jgi:hypothetical protein
MIDALVIVLSLAAIVLNVLVFIQNDRSHKRLLARLNRNQKVYEFRKEVLEKRPYLYKHLPDYEVMFKDGKQLEMENYFTPEQLREDGSNYN